MYLNNGIRCGGCHLFFDGHTELDVFPPGKDFLAGQKAVQGGVLGYTAAVGSQEHMENAEVRHSFLPLLADVAVKDRDLKGVREQVGCAVPVDHKVGGYLIHRGHGTDPAAIGAVAPDGMIRAVSMDPDGEYHDCRAQEHQHIRQ